MVIIIMSVASTLHQDVVSPDIVARPDDEVDFIFPDFFDVIECRIDERHGSIAGPVRNTEMGGRTIIVGVKVCAKCVVLQ